MINPNEVARSSARLDAAMAKRSQSRVVQPEVDIYQNLSVVRRLSKAKFPVYLTCSKVNGHNYAMKIFAQRDNKPHPYFRNEVRFSCLKHPNIIETVFHETEKDTLYKGEMKKVSYILMEFAPHGDFFDFVTKHREEIDEKLARTYFKQLIDGIEYMHASRVAHLDLKPENLLIGPNYELKVADFDLSHVRGDSRILSRGTRYYRAPEFFRSTEEPQLSHPFSADVYSAGIILFILKSGGVYPHSENNLLEGIDLVDLMHNNNVEFWKKHCEIQEKPLSYFDRTFRELFNGMTRERPEDRFTLEDIKQNRWYKGPVYTQEEVYLKMRRIMRHQ